MQPALDFFRKRAVLLKIESEEGEDSAPVVGTDGFRLFDGSASIDYDTVERPEDKPHLGHDPFVLANPRVGIQGTFELWPPAEPGQATNSDAWAAIVLRPAGMAVTKSASGALTRYNPVSTAIATVTGHWYHTRELIKGVGIRADISALKMEIGQRFTGQVSLMGELSAEVEATTDPTVVLPTKVPVVASKRNSVCRISTLVRGGTPSTDGTPLVNLRVWAKLLQVDLGNSPTYKEYTEKGATTIDRRSTFTLRIAETDITNDFNPEYCRRHHILIEADWRLWETDAKDGLYSILGFRGQIETVTRVDIDKDKGWEIKGRCLPSPSANDEWYAGFGDNRFQLRGTLPNGTEEVAYVATGPLATGDYEGTLAWTITGGALPDGLSINASTGVISGTPADGEAGSYTVEITATDDTSPTPKTAVKEFTFTIAA